MKIAVVIPCYRVGERVLEVVASVGPECSAIYVVDDACPEHSGDLVKNRCDDPRVVVLRLEANRGVGGASLAGYEAAIADARKSHKFRFLHARLAPRAPRRRSNRVQPKTVHT